MLVIALFCLSAFCAVAVNKLAVKRDHTPIHIVHRPINQSPAPRTPVVNPFFAQLEDTHVLLGSTSPCGVVAVSLVSTSGDNYSANFDTDDWTIIIPVSGNPGHYTLTLVTESGAVFEGEFDI